MTNINTTRGPRPALNLNPFDQTAALALPIRSDIADSPQILDTIWQAQRMLSADAGAVAFVRQFTESILPRTLGNNQVARAANAVADYVRGALTYTRDPVGVEMLISPLVLINTIIAGQPARGDCDDHVLLLNTILESIGIEARPVAVQLFATDRYDHVITQALLPDGWTDFDPCVKNGGRPVYRERLVVA